MSGVRFEIERDRAVGCRVVRVDGDERTPLEHGPIDRATAQRMIARLERKARRKPRGSAIADGAR